MGCVVSDNFNSIRTSLPRVVSLCLVFPSRSLSCAVLALLVRVLSFGLDSVTPTLDVAQGRRSVTLKSVLTSTYQLAGWGGGGGGVVCVWCVGVVCVCGCGCMCVWQVRQKCLTPSLPKLYNTVQPCSTVSPRLTELAPLAGGTSGSTAAPARHPLFFPLLPCFFLSLCLPPPRILLVT